MNRISVLICISLSLVLACGKQEEIDIPSDLDYEWELVRDDLDSVRDMMRYDGKLWVATQNSGITVIDRTSLGFERWTTDNSNIPTNHLTSIEVDHEGAIWVGSIDMGLLRFKDDQWIIYNSANSLLPKGEITALIMDDRHLNIGTDSGLLRLWEDGEIRWQGTGTNAFGARITCLELDYAGKLWVGTKSQGMIQRVESRPEWNPHTSSNGSYMQDNEIRTINRTKKFELYVASFDHFYIFDNNWLTYDALESGLPSPYVNHIAFDTVGTAYFATHGGLQIMSKDDTTTFLPSNSPLPSGIVERIIGENDSTFWIGTFNGVCKLTRRSF